MCVWIYLWKLWRSESNLQFYVPTSDEQKTEAADFWLFWETSSSSGRHRSTNTALMSKNREIIKGKLLLWWAPHPATTPALHWHLIKVNKEQWAAACVQCWQQLPPPRSLQRGAHPPAHQLNNSCLSNPPTMERKGPDWETGDSALNDYNRKPGANQ